ncbi:hypothetical protein TSUD_193070 [Trifolium subterraneum]|uniref:Uncharacterized protein n=1 Tax=Trifolium subterraneum TaxID=3900 RepID=A0A2Z6PCD6_TRISU|nr:hypothetical protein TSUD_193070 [Trifolium subterraneum]
MESQQSNNQLHVIFLPYPSPCHMIPMIDTARLFANHGVNVTIITTHANASTLQKTIDSDFNSGYSIKTQLIQFPSSQVGLPDGVENVKDVKGKTSLEMLGHNFIWVVRKNDRDDEDGEGFLRDFEERMKESGGIVTHCGRNSILESL